MKSGDLFKHLSCGPHVGAKFCLDVSDHHSQGVSKMNWYLSVELSFQCFESLQSLRVYSSKVVDMEELTNYQESRAVEISCSWVTELNCRDVSVVR